jgi:carbon storage regulator CsrA
MLVLSRKCHEAVAVGGADGFKHLLKVTVLAIQAGKVSLGFDIDDAVPVHRWEVWERLCAGNPPDNARQPRGEDCTALH